MIGKSYYKQGKYNEALEFLNKAKEYSSNLDDDINREIYQYIALSHYKLVYYIYYIIYY